MTRWSKNSHLERLLLSQGSVMSLLEKGVSESELGIDVFREQVEQILGAIPQPWHWSARLRYGIA